VISCKKKQKWQKSAGSSAASILFPSIKSKTKVNAVRDIVQDKGSSFVFF
jgi:hypothetical protein